MSALIGLLAGLLLAATELHLRLHLPLVPDLAALALAWLLVRPGSRTRVASFTGVLLGASTFSADPVGSWLLGGGLAALLLVPLREIVFLESALTQAIFGLVAAVALRAARELYVWFDLTPALPWGRASWSAPLLAALALPILVRLLGGAGRMARWLAERIGALRDRAAGRQPS